MSGDFLVVEPGRILEMNLAKQCAEVLDKHYPGYLWAVNVNSEQGIANVHNLSLSGKWGFVLRLKEVQEDARLKCMVEAGGELLERYRLRRGPVNLERLDELPTDFAGHFVMDKG